VVNSSDVTRTRNNFSAFGTVGLESVYDFNRDGRVTSGDVTIARNHFSGFTPLRLVTPPTSAPGALGGSPLVAAPYLRPAAVPRCWPPRAKPLLPGKRQRRVSPSLRLRPTSHLQPEPDRWDVRLYGDLAWSWELARPKPKQKLSDGDFSSQDVRQWMLADYGR